jgi:hypothetical protein
MAWYENPQVWTAIVALLALFIGILNLFTIKGLHRENARQKFRTDLQTLVTQINDAFAKYEVDTPYQVKMGLKGDKIVRGKIVLLILQLNLLGVVFTSRSTLAAEELKDWTDWAEKILRPWIEQDETILAAYKYWVTSQDGGKDYTAWLKDLMKIVV